MEWAGNGWFYQHHFFSQVVVEGHVVLDPPESTHLRFTPKDKRRYTSWWYDNCSMPDERNHIQNPHPLNCSWLQRHCAWSTSWVYQGALIVDPLALHMKWKSIGTHSYILVPTLCSDLICCTMQLGIAAHLPYGEKFIWIYYIHEIFSLQKVIQYIINYN